MPKRDKLSPFFLEDLINFRIGELRELKKELEQTPDLPSALKNKRLRVVKSHNTFQYFLRTRGNDVKGKYIPKKEDALPKLMADFEYKQKLLSKINSELKLFIQFSKKYSDNSIQSVYEKLHPGKQRLITPVILPTASFIAKWQSREYSKMGFYENCAIFYSSKGEQMRSKSEVILADTFTRHGIPYRYEYPLKLKAANGEKITIHPDFCCLNVRIRKKIYWEHFGMMDNSDYVAKAVNKIEAYHKNGYFEGDNLIYTFESPTTPLNNKLVEQIIDRFLK